MKTIWLHIGTRKAGSTAIQDFLCHNQKQLLEMGYDYPTNFSEQAKQSLKNALMGLPQCGNLNQLILNSLSKQPQTMSQLLANLKLPENKDIIFSAENFFFLHMNEKLLADFKKTLLSKTKNHQIKIIFYLRRQDEIVEAMYRQDIQDVNYKAFKFHERYMEDPDTISTLNFKKIIDVFSKHFGKENMIIRPFEREQLKDKNVVTDYIDILGIKDTSKLKLNLESNVSFSHEIVEFLRLTKTYTPVLHKRLTNYFTLANPKVRSEKISMADPNIKRKVAQEHEKMNNEIAREFLKQDKLFLKETPKEDKNWKPYSMSADDAVRASSVLFNAITKQLFSLQDEVRTLKLALKTFLEAQINEELKDVEKDASKKKEAK